MACRATSQPSDTTVYLHRSPKLASCNSRCLIPCSRHEVVTTPLRRRQTAHRVHRMRESTCGYRKVDTTADRDAFKRKVDMKTRLSVSRTARNRHVIPRRRAADDIFGCQRPRQHLTPTREFSARG